MRGCSSINYRNTRTRWRFIHAWRGSIRSRESVRGGAVSECGVSAAWARGMPRAGWAGRPTPVLPCAQDCAHEQAAAKPTWTYLLRPRTPTPPRQPTEYQPLLLRLPASGRHYRRCRAQSCRKTHIKKQQAEACCFGVMVRPERFELPTAWFVARYSIQLSYGRPATGAELCGCRRAPSTVL